MWWWIGAWAYLSIGFVLAVLGTRWWRTEDDLGDYAAAFGMVVAWPLVLVAGAAWFVLGLVVGAADWLEGRRDD